MSESTQNAAELTNEQVSTILTQPLQARSVFLAAGPTIFDTDGSPVRVPTAGDPVTDVLDFVGENEQITEQDVDFDEVTLLPSTMKSIKTLTRFSNELARQSIVSLDGVLKNRLVTDVAARLDKQFLGAAGDGTTTPLGLFAYAGVQNIDAAGPLDLDAVLAAQGLALGANVDMDKLKMFITPADFMALRGIKDADNRYMLQPDASLAAGYRVLGVPVVVSPHVPDGNAALVDMSQIGVARDLAPTVKILDQTYGDYDQQAIRVVARYDAKPLNAAAIVTVTGITAGA